LVPGGLASVARTLWAKVLELVAASTPRVHEPEEDGPLLRVEGVLVRFGGVTALDDVSIAVAREEVVGLIGGNGAGKTTLLNCVSGLQSVDGGHVHFMGRDLTQLGPEYRAHFGISRSFQDARLFPGLTVREIIQMSVMRRAPHGLLAAAFGMPWVRWHETRHRQRTQELIEMFGLADFSDVRAHALSTGTRRVCDLACQVATGAALVVLDEPTAGVAQREVELLGDVLRKVRSELACSMLIVEHDVHFLADVADRMVCLEDGRVIATGTPREVLSDPAVVASYLGSDHRATNRSGNGNGSARRKSTGRKKGRPIRTAGVSSKGGTS
jgi:ABC-type branched-subunit amino acid transport system ATPase component